MNIEKFLSEKLQRFSLVDIMLVRVVYLLIGLLTASLYTQLAMISWIFYVVMMLIAGSPIIFRLFSFEGSMLSRAKQFVKSNMPSFQILLFFISFFLGCALVSAIPWLIGVDWWIYVGLIVVFAIKPMKSNMFW